jgi:hypothetical protein
MRSIVAALAVATCTGMRSLVAGLAVAACTGMRRLVAVLAIAACTGMRRLVAGLAVAACTGMRRLVAVLAVAACTGMRGRVAILAVAAGNSVRRLVAVLAVAACTGMRSLVAVLAVAACNSSPFAPAVLPGSPESLVAHLQTVVGPAADAAARQRAVADWQLDESQWAHTVVALYRPLYAEYQRAFAAEAPALAARLARGGPITARRHYAGDPRLTLSQARDRWALPTLYPSLVAEAGGAPIDAVFVPAGDQWRALIGLDGVVRAHVAALDPGCATSLDLAGPTGRCTDVGAAIASAALRTDREQLAHVCRLAETLCGKGSP